MKNLFIIGNGFDLHHGLNTKYEDFRQYLLKRFPEANGDEFIVPEMAIDKDGAEIYNDVEVVSYLLWMISNVDPCGEKWSDLENTLGFLDYSECFDYTSVILDKEGDPDLWKNMYNMQDLASSLIGSTMKIADLFVDWINTINVSEILPNKAFMKLINSKNDLFINFNYTKTLELVYEIKNVCHIHGEVGAEIIFGHGNENDNYEYHQTRYTGAEGALQEIHYALKKDTKSAIIFNRHFFDAIEASPIAEIFSIGFSFSQVDQVYIKTICKKLHTNNSTWLLSSYEPPEKRNEFQAIIRKCGFKGQFSTFAI